MYQSVKTWNLRYDELLPRHELQLINAGFRNPLNRWGARDCLSPFWVLWYNFEQGNFCVLRDKRIQLGPEKLLLIPPNVFYSGEFEKAVPHFYVWFQTAGCFGNSGREAVELPVQPYLKRLREAVVPGEKQLFTLYTLISEILCDIPETFFDSSETTHKALVIEKALRFINQENGNVSNEMIAAHLHLSLTRLLHLFKAEIGISPQKYCSQIKMFHAERMLLAGDPIQSVADACGFADRYHFSKEFKRRHQLPPGKWQRNHLKAAEEKQK